MTKYFVSAIRFLLRAICYIYRSIYGWFIHYSIQSCGKNITVWPRIKIYGGNNINIGKNVIIRKNYNHSSTSKIPQSAIQPNHNYRRQC